MKEYVIMRNGKYIQECEQAGLFNKVNDLDKASTFPSAENAQAFVEQDMKLNIANVSIHAIETVITETPLVISDNKFVDINTVKKCAVCGKWLTPNEIYAYKHDLESPVEWLCSTHYAELDDKYANEFDNMMGNPLDKLDKLFNIKGVK
jgi:hypothetical protein